MHGLERGGCSLPAQFCGADRHRLEHLAACGDKHVYRDPRESLLGVDIVSCLWTQPIVGYLPGVGDLLDLRCQFVLSPLVLRPLD